jgi:RimJ/RimL family protein N-acetyltransferase
MTGQVQADVQVRAVRRSDAPRLERFYAGLSPEARHHRFLATRLGISSAEAASFACVDHERREGFVAIRREHGHAGPIVGHLCLEPAGDQRVEFAIVVADAAQHQHVGTTLLAAGLAWAEAHGVLDLEAITEVDNVAMLHLAQASDAWTTIGPAADGTVPLTLPTLAEGA